MWDHAIVDFSFQPLSPSHAHQGFPRLSFASQWWKNIAVKTSVSVSEASKVWGWSHGRTLEP